MIDFEPKPPFQAQPGDAAVHEKTSSNFLEAMGEHTHYLNKNGKKW